MALGKQSTYNLCERLARLHSPTANIIIDNKYNVLKSQFLLSPLAFFIEKLTNYAQVLFFLSKKAKKAASFPYCFTKQYLLLIRETKAYTATQSYQKL